MQSELSPNAYVNILKGLEVSASLGIHEIELTTRQRVVLSVWLHADYGAERPADRIDAVVDYDFLRTRISELVAARHFNLQETLCDAIAELALVDRRIRQVRVRSVKPDIYPDASIGCEVVRCRTPCG